MDEYQGQTDCKAGRLASAVFGISCSKNYEDEYASCDDLDEAGSCYTSGVCYAVSSHSCRVTHCAGCACGGDDSPEKECSEDTAEELADPVSASVFPGHTF